MRPQDIITNKRDGGELSDPDIAEFIGGVCDGSWADYQISALLMAMFIRGLNEREGGSLVREMLQSGDVLDLSGISKPKADKHSTGGVGDKTSIIIAPLVASCGIAVPMISGRGLGHTGGTLDKLESIPGYRVDLQTSEFLATIDGCGFAMNGQTAEIAPADKKLYALRDATATVPYIPLIVASIMSKKLAEGLDALVLDVKTGSGAFMKDLEASKALGKALSDCGKQFGVSTQAVISDMSEPLGAFVGNQNEIYECVAILRGEDSDQISATRDLSLELAARMVSLSGIEKDLESSRALVESKLADGSALEAFRRNCELQGGDPSFIDKPEAIFSEGLLEMSITADRSGYVAAVDALGIGEAIVAIGGGRRKAEDTIDHAVGFKCVTKVGDEVRPGDELGRLYYRDKRQADSVSEKLRSTYTISGDPVERTQLIHAIIE